MTVNFFNFRVKYQALSDPVIGFACYQMGLDHRRFRSPVLAP
jgi:hypothetical protein